MKIDKISTMVVFGIISILMISAIFIPIIDSSFYETTKFENTNSAYAQLNEVDPDTEYVLSKDAGVGAVWEVNGVDVTLGNLSYIVLTDTFSIMNYANTTTNSALISIIGSSNITIPTANECTITFNNGVATLLFGESQTATYNYTYAYALAPYGLGEYTTSVANEQTIYVNSLNDVMAYTTDYSIKDGIIKNASDESEISGGVALDGYSDVIIFDSSHYVLGQLGDQEVSVRYLVVPVDIIGVKIYEDKYNIELILSVLPILAMVGVIIAIGYNMKLRD